MIERLPEKKKYIFISREGSAIAPSGNTLLATYTPDKYARITSVELEAPRLARALLIYGNRTKRYRLQTAGMLIDGRTFEDFIVDGPANQPIYLRLAPGISGLAGEIFSGSFNLWKMKP